MAASKCSVNQDHYISICVLFQTQWSQAGDRCCHLSTGTLPPGAHAGESAPAERYSSPASPKAGLSLHQAHSWPICPSKHLGKDMPRACWVPAPEEGPGSWTFSSLSAARQGLGASVPSGRVLSKQGGLEGQVGGQVQVGTCRLKQCGAKAGAGDCNSLEEAWLLQIQTVPVVERSQVLPRMDIPSSLSLGLPAYDLAPPLLRIRSSLEPTGHLCPLPRPPSSWLCFLGTGQEACSNGGSGPSQAPQRKQ